MSNPTEGITFTTTRKGGKTTITGIYEDGDYKIGKAVISPVKLTKQVKRALHLMISSAILKRLQEDGRL